MATRFLPRKLHLAFRNAAWDTGENIKSLIALQGSPEHIAFWDDFVGSDASTWPASANWMYPATVGTGTEVIGITAAFGGTLTATTGATSGNGAYQYLGLNWRGTEGIYAIWYAKYSSASVGKFEIGLTDSITNEGIIATAATPTFTATNSAAFIFDSSGVGAGASATTGVFFITENAGAIGNASGVPDLSPIAWDTNYHVYEIRVQGGSATGYMDGQQVGGGTILSTAVLGPQVAGSTARSAVAMTTTVDYAGCISPRSAV